MHLFLFLNLFLSMICFWNEYTQHFETKRTSTSSAPFSILFFSTSFFVLTIELINRWISSKHIPLSNLYESLLFLNWNLIAIYFFLIRNEIWTKEGATRPIAASSTGIVQPNIYDHTESNEVANRSTKSRSFIDMESIILFFQIYTKPLGLIGPLLSSIILFIQSFADWRLPDEMKQIQPLIPALQSNWLLMHVSIMILSYAALFVGCILAITYVGAEWYLNLDGRASLRHESQSTVSQSEINISAKSYFTKLDSLSYRILAFAFPLLTLGILSGAIWANEAWGSYWSWDPKETWAFITWLIFAFYLHTRLQYKWEGSKSASVASIGFFIIWICYLGVNLLGQGLHSYGWINN